MHSDRDLEVFALKLMLIFRLPDRVRSLTPPFSFVFDCPGRWTPRSRLTWTASSLATLVGRADAVATRPGVGPSNMLEEWVEYGYGAKCHAFKAGDTMHIQGEAVHAQRPSSNVPAVPAYQKRARRASVKGAEAGG